MKLQRWHMVSVITKDGKTRECKTTNPEIGIQALVQDPTDVVSVAVINTGTYQETDDGN